MGKHISMLSPPDRSDESTQINQRIMDGERVQGFETERFRKDGKRIFFSLTVSPVKDSSGKIIGASAIARHHRSKKNGGTAETALGAFRGVG